MSVSAANIQLPQEVLVRGELLQSLEQLRHLLLDAQVGKESPERTREICLTFRRVPDLTRGESDATETSTFGSEESVWKSICLTGNSLGVYFTYKTIAVSQVGIQVGYCLQRFMLALGFVPV